MNSTTERTSPIEHGAPPLRVAWIAAGSETFGVRRATLTLAGALVKRGWPVTVLVLGEDAHSDDYQSRGLEVIHTGVEEAPAVRRAGVVENVRQFLDLLSYERKSRSQILRAIQDRKFDFMHVRTQKLVGIAGRVAHSCGVPCFWQMPNLLGSGYPLDINRLLYQLQCRARGVIPLANSACTQESLGYPLVKSYVLHLGSDTRIFDPEKVQPATRESLGIPRDAIVFGIYARLVPEKGQMVFLQALMSIESPPAPLHLLLLGGPVEGAFASELRKVASAGGWAERCHIAGTKGDTERYYDLLDVAVNSRLDPEPFGLSVIEAMMMGRPVLAHASGGPEITVIDGETGWHMAAPTVAAFANGIRRALADRARWPEMRLAARRHALQHYTVDTLAENYMGIVRDCLKTAGRRRS